jgi:hypothetical protein
MESILMLKMTAFWNTALYSLVEIDQHFRNVCCLHHEGTGGASTHPWNIGLIQRDYTALYPGRLSSKYLVL